MNGIDSKILRKFVKLAGDRLSGRWVIIGGSAVHFISQSVRVTLDIDLAGPAKASQEDTMVLMEIAETLGLPVEAINQAGAFFLRQINDWESYLILLHRGKTASFFRPDATLFLLLKMKRLSETDLADCVTYLEFANENKEALDFIKINKALKFAIKNASSSDQSERLQILQKLLR